MCVKAVPSGMQVAVRATVWRLAYPDASTAEPSNVTYNQFPAPRYPTDERIVPVGRCVRGWLTFVAPQGKRPQSVEYQPDGDQPLNWVVA
jgi:hypothetical protein